MKFTRVIGKIDPKLVAQAEEKLSKVFLELGTRYDNVHVGSQLGGDPLIFSLMYPVAHYCTNNIPTAATNGSTYFWSPKFVIKQSIKGLRIVCAHEAWHAIYMHPSRRGSRIPKLWNIAVDYIVNGTVMEDFKARKKDPAAEFSKNLGRYMTLPQFCEMVKNPFAKIAGFEDINPTVQDPNAPLPGMPAPGEDRELTTAEQKELERREKGVRFYYADPDLPEDMKRPEKIYDLLYSLMPKCPKCGRIGMYQKPQPQKKDGKKGGKKDKQDAKDKGDKGDKGQDKQPGDQPGDHGDQHDHGDGQPCGCDDPNGQQPGQGNQGQGCNGSGPCDTCGGGVDIFGLGGTVDDHMDADESEEKMAKRISEAMEAAKKLAGHVPAALEDELGKLTAPKLTWKDLVRARLLKARAGNGRNDWTRFRSRPMFSGVMVPKRRSYYSHFGCLLDTSGSMSREDMAFGISQLTSLDERSEGTITCGDAEIYWSQSTKIKKANAEELSKIKVMGRGGTMFADYFTDYEDNIGECDFLIVITDGFLMDSDVASMQHPGIEVIWLLTASSSFVPPFGRAFDLHNV